MLLHQISGGDPITSMVINNLRKYCPVLDYLHFFRQPGSGAHERYGDDVDGTFSTRTIGNNFGAQDLNPNYGDFALKIIGKNVTLDTAFEERGGDVPSEFRIKLESWSENAGRDLMYYLLDGDSDADNGATPPVNLNQFDGLRKHIATLVTAGDAARVISLGANGLLVTLGNDNTARTAQQKLVEGIDELIGSVDGGADLLLMDDKVLTRLSSVAKEQCLITLNQFGAKIGNYNGVPIVPTSRKYDGSRIIPFTETVGTSTDCGSVFAFKSAEKAHLTAMTTSVGLKVYPMEKVGQLYQHMVQFQMDMQPLSKRCVAKLAGIRL